MRIVIAEDNVLLAEGLASLLESSGHQVLATATDCKSLVDSVMTHRPEISIVDVRLPPSFRDEGIKAALRARSALPRTPILVLSQYVEGTYAGELLADGGGVGYLLKDRVARVGDFLDALTRVADGDTVLDPDVVKQLLVRKGNPLSRLSGREIEVLGLMAQGKANGEIASTLVITERAVHKHIGNIFTKLDLAPTDSGHRRVRAVLAYLEQ